MPSFGKFYLVWSQWVAEILVGLSWRSCHSRHMGIEFRIFCSPRRTRDLQNLTNQSVDPSARWLRSVGTRFTPGPVDGQA